MSHFGFHYKLHDVGVGGDVFGVIAVFLSDRVRRVVVDGIRSTNVRVNSGFRQVLFLVLCCFYSA